MSNNTRKLMKNHLTRTALALAAALTLVSSATAQVIFFDLQGKAGFGLLAGNENATILGTPGSGGEFGPGFSYDMTTKVLTINFAWGAANGFANLQGATAGSVGAATGYHIHGPTTTADPFLGNASVLHNISGGTAGGGAIPNYTAVNDPAGHGSVTGTISNIPLAQETDLLAGKWYVNVHSALNGGGEIRGNLVVIPEPSSLTLLGLGLMAWLGRRHLIRV